MLRLKLKSMLLALKLKKLSFFNFLIYYKFDISGVLRLGQNLESSKQSNIAISNFTVVGFNSNSNQHLR